MTGDGEDDTVTLHFQAASAATPYTWTLVIESDGRTIYHIERDDADLDMLFGDADSMEGCENYAACKHRYYYEQILGGLIPADLDLETILDKSSPQGLYGVGRAFLRQCCARAGVEKAVTNIAVGLRNGSAAVVTVPDSPVAAGPLMVYSEDAGVFVPVYKE